MIIDFVKIITPAVIAFAVGIAITPLLTEFLYKNKMWKKKAGKTAYDGNEAVVFNSLHKEKEIGTPRMGGIVIWASAVITMIGIWILATIFKDYDIITKIDFVSRSQTWIPLATLITGALIGLIDDYAEIRGNTTHFAGGLSLKKRLAVVGTMGLLCGWWFYDKLDVTSIGLPGGYLLEIGWLIIPLFVITILGVYSSGVIDGLDGLAGGIFSTIFASYAIIAYSLNQVNLAAFCTLIVGATLAFLWFNIPPARFYMSETGTMALTVTLTVVVFMTDSLGGGYGLLVLPVVALPLVITSTSVVLQLLSKKFRGGKKIFKVAPIHHHFEAIGWPAYKVTMRFWVIGVVSALLGIIFALIA